jgi:hypothetical protein
MPDFEEMKNAIARAIAEESSDPDDDAFEQDVCSPLDCLDTQP